MRLFGTSLSTQPMRVTFLMNFWLRNQVEFVGGPLRTLFVVQFPTAKFPILDQTLRPIDACNFLNACDGPQGGNPTSGFGSQHANGANMVLTDGSAKRMPESSVGGRRGFIGRNPIPAPPFWKGFDPDRTEP